MEDQKGFESWVRVTLNNESSSGSMEVKEATLKCGKWYKPMPAPEGDMEKDDVPPDGKTFKKGSPVLFASCGVFRDSPHGTKGSVDIYHGTTLVAVIGWNCCSPPEVQNSTSVTNANSSYEIVQEPKSVPANGALGNITFTIAHHA